jgi:hypothetical protein
MPVTSASPSESPARTSPFIPFLNRSCRFRRAADSAVARQGEVDKGTNDSEMELAMRPVVVADTGPLMAAGESRE